VVRTGGKVDLRGRETWPVTSFEGAIGVLLYGIFALEQVCGEGRGVVRERARLGELLS
jgi:hypothetical protein